MKSFFTTLGTSLIGALCSAAVSKTVEAVQGRPLAVMGETSGELWPALVFGALFGLLFSLIFFWVHRQR